MPFEDAEIECNDCKPSGFFIVHVNSAWKGPFLFACPKCGRKHPRTCKDGKFVGQAEFDEAMKASEAKFLTNKIDRIIIRDTDSTPDKDRPVIMSPPSAWSPTRRLEQLRLVNSGILEHSAMAEAWQRKIANERGDTDRQEEYNGELEEEKKAAAIQAAAETKAAKKGIISRLFGKKS